MQTKRFTLGLVLVVGCSSSPSDKQLPSATFTPHFEAQSASNVACGEDIAFYGNPSPDLTYAFAYDNQGRITAANGVWAYDGSTEDTLYTWNGWNLTNMLSTSSYDGSTWEITAAYNAQNALTDYTWEVAGPNYQDSWTYAYSLFVNDAPTRETVSQQGQQVVAYDLVYDAGGRLVSATPDNGPVTTWAYDDAAGTITIDTGNGAFTGVATFDADFKELSEVYGGSDPSVIDSESTFDWTGDRLDSATYRSGSEQAPHTLELVQDSTYKYNCASARQHVGKLIKGPRPARIGR
jgi:YD repeat-containing protein